MPSILEYDLYFDRLRTVSAIIRPIVRHETIRWSHEEELEQIIFAGDNSSTWSTLAVS